MSPEESKNPEPAAQPAPEKSPSGEGDSERRRGPRRPRRRRQRNSNQGGSQGEQRSARSADSVPAREGQENQEQRRGGRRRRSRRGNNRRSGGQEQSAPIEVPEDQLEPVCGLFDAQKDGTGSLRFVQNYYLASDKDVFVTRDLVRKYSIRPGSIVDGDSAPPRKRGGRRVLYRIHKINEKAPELHADEVPFRSLLPCDPYERFELETKDDPDISMRIIDLLAPIGRGQRALIVAPPRSGKTVILQKMANAIHESHPEVKVVILLIDERPEEVTDFKRNTNAEVIASCLDEGTANHVRVTEITLERLKRQVEAGHHIVCLLDSITRLGRAYNNETKHSGRILSGGVDAKTLAKPKAFFGAARTIEDGGSLTIIATALVDTGSRMDQVIFEEFKGTGNMELVLSRQLANNRIYPAIDVGMTGTRKEEKLLEPDVYKKVTVLRRVLSQLNPMEAMRLLVERIEKTASNAEFLAKFDVER